LSKGERLSDAEYASAIKARKRKARLHRPEAQAEMKLSYHVDGIAMTTQYGNAQEAMRAFNRISGSADLVRMLDDRGHTVLSAMPRHVFEPLPVPKH
jgi:hypothetical protein